MQIILSERHRHLPVLHNPRMDKAFLAAINQFGYENILNITIGSPDKEPKKEVVDIVSQLSADPSNYKYVVPAYGKPKLLESAASFRSRLSGINLDPTTQISFVHGSRLALLIALMNLTNPKDLVMAPGKYYPGLRNAIITSFCRPVYYLVAPETNQFEEIKKAHQQAILDFGRPPKVCFVTPVGNPWGKAVERSFFPKLIEFAKENNLVIVSDEAYLYHVFSGKEGFSLMQFEGGNEVGISLYTMSKIANVPALRAAFAEGNGEIIEGFKRVLSSPEYGQSVWTQEAVIEALKPIHDGFIKENTDLYEERNREVIQVCEQHSVETWESDGGMFTPIVIPANWRHLGSEEVAARILELTGVRVNPGKVHGDEADGLLRAANVQDKLVMRKGAELICECFSKRPDEVKLPDDASSSYIV